MTHPVSGCCFIKNTFLGAFCLFESMASLLPFVDDMTILDLGSTDGTEHYLKAIANSNPRVRVLHGEFPATDAGVFATLANTLIAGVKHDAVLYWQADEIWHEDLLLLMEERFKRDEFDLSFWRIQYRDNFQTVKWFPHVVHRVGVKGRFNFVGDGMNTDRFMEPPICSDYGGEYFMQWGQMGQEKIKPYVNQMITDVSMVGGFRDNIPFRRMAHAPFWHEEPTIEGKPASQWHADALADPKWTRPASPYNLPKALRFHVGRTSYEFRSDLFDALCRDTTREWLGI